MTMIDTARTSTMNSGGGNAPDLRALIRATAAELGVTLAPSQLERLVASLSPIDRLLASTSPVDRMRGDAGARSGAGGTYTVARGDTLSGIAQRQGVSLARLLAANPSIADANRIMPGQQITLPGATAAQSYSVRAGDTLSGIAERFGTDWKSLASLNGLANPNLLQVGQSLRLPGATPPASPGSAPAEVARSAPAAAGRDVASGVSAAGMDALFAREAQAGVSNRPHWPGGVSGVTLGPGYDLKGRSQSEVISTLTAIGVDRAAATRVAQGAGLEGRAARDFAAANRDAVNLTGTQERALLGRVVQPYAADVRAMVRVPLNQNQYDALVSFAYNIGTGRGGFPDSTVLRRLNAGDYRGAADAMAAWNKSGGEVNQGLINRRAGEIAQFNTAAAPAALPGRPAPAAPAPATRIDAPAPARTPEGYAAYVAQYGDATAKADLAAGRRIVVALRTDTNVRANGGAGVYDDTIAVVQRGRDGQISVREFRGNTEPSGQYRFDGARASKGSSVDMNGDGRNDSGRLLPGSYRYVQQEGKFAGDTYFRATQTAAVERDTNQDGVFDARDPNRIDRTGAGTSMLIHRGGDDNTWSAGCQTIPRGTYADFQAALGGQRAFSYVLVNG